ncbi:hypothetical protein NDU88_005469 [Pleurodeles waltl]|uniref:Secreted protein n=1 Tax=Pleurodeles waltl TaxID=8319 RepID=A0AAV7QEV5_PLEWA|nr:hypothetical protein NDU88_005469 [Pleurodeles waltl]
MWFCRWAGPVFGSVWLGQLQAAEACVLCMRVTVSSRQRHGKPGAVAVMCCLVGRTSLAEDAFIRDAVDKKVDVSLKKAYSGTHLALRARIYGTYFAQSLLLNLKALNSALDRSSDCLGLMSFI